MPINTKTVRFPNWVDYVRSDVGYATIPFKKGEWNGKPLLVRDKQTSTQIKDSWIIPYGAKYNDGSYRFGSLLVKVKIPKQSDYYIEIVEPTIPIQEPIFKFAPGTQILLDSRLEFIMLIGSRVHSAPFLQWTMREDNGMRKVYQSRQRINNTDFTADLKCYVYNNQDTVRWELRIIGSNPDNNKFAYLFDEIRLAFIGEKGFLNIRAAENRGAKIIKPYKDYCILDGPSYIGDGQSQMWFGEILLSDLKDDESTQNALASVRLPLWGMSLNWRDSQEALGPFGVVPNTPVLLPDNGFEAIRREFNDTWNYIHTDGDPWDDYPKGLTKTPSQTGSQDDFGLIEGWDILYTGYAELLKGYYYLAQEECKRPGHYMERDGSPIESKNHPEWVTWDGRTHYDFRVSPERLGKDIPYLGGLTHGWDGKDWEHHSSNLLYLATLLTRSYSLLDEINVEVELWHAGHTLPSTHPGRSTNDRFPPRAFGRTQLAMLQHYILTSRQDIIDRSLKRFREVVRDKWDGASRGPVKNWSHKIDGRVIPGRPAWVPWDESLGFKGIVALYNITQDPEVKKFMIEWGTTIVKYGWRAKRDNTGKITDLIIGNGVYWNDNGQPITPEQYLDPNYFNPGVHVSLWGIHVLKFAKNSGLFDSSTQKLAAEYYDFMAADRLADYDPLRNPFDVWGKWEAII